MIHTSDAISQFANTCSVRASTAILDRSLHDRALGNWSDMRLVQKHGRARRGRRGQIMVILALAAVRVVGIAALGIDVFYIYWNKKNLQGPTDAAALAGPTDFNNVTFLAKNAACLFAA